MTTTEISSGAATTGTTSRRPFAVLTTPRSREITTIFVVLATLEWVVFGDFFSGRAIPSGDFLSAYNYEAYAWWRDGSFFSPTQWMPYMWGGYPSVSNLQNSSYYLPVGIAAAFGPFTLHASAILSALHVAAGALGAYVFARRWGARMSASLIGLVGWFFAIGFYSNASHLDISRSYAWVPWIMLVLSVRWPWSRWWSAPVAVLVLWQGVLGTYPGILVAFAYTLGVWVIVQAIVFRPRFTRFLLPVIFVSIAAAAMTLIRFLPWLAERGTLPYEAVDISRFTAANVATFLYPYHLAEFTAFSQFMSYFVPSTLLVGLAFVRWRSRLAISLAATIAASALVGLPLWPWHEWVLHNFPGLTLSRFVASDFKPVLLFGLAMLSVSAVNGVFSRDGRAREAKADVTPRARAKTLIAPGAYLVVLLAGATVLWWRFQYGGGFAPQWGLLIMAAAALVANFVIQRPSRIRSALVIFLILSTAVSGVLSVYSTTREWRADRVATEQLNLGSSVDNLIASRSDAVTYTQRPARIPPGPLSDPLAGIDSHLGAAFYTGISDVQGYVNLRGTESFERVRMSVGQPGEAGIDAGAFWSAPGIIMESGTVLPNSTATATCASSGVCGPHLTTTPISYGSSSTLVYGISATAPVVVSANETYYQGWSATICPTDSAHACQVLPTARGGNAEISMVIPQGEWTLTLNYQLPHLSEAWVAFWVGVAITLGMVLLTLRVRFRRGWRIP